jgi:MoaE-MoaD fusion protein
VTITVLYFAAARERAGLAREEFSTAPSTVGALLEEVCARHPTLQPLLPHLRVAVNQEFTSPEQPVPDGAEVALIPPVAGGSGSPLFKVVDRPLALDEVVRAVSTTGHGGVVTFTGAVRDHSHGKRVLRLEYEAYAPMAEKKLAEIGQEIQTRWPGIRVAIVHRTGTLEPGEAAVVIAASAPHRKEAFLACEYAIDRLKQDVPIWKKEFFEGGEVWVGLGP